METQTKIKISREEISDMIKEKLKIDGIVEFIINEEIYNNGWCDGIQHYGKRYHLTGVEITVDS